MNCQTADQPKESGLLDPNENSVTELDQLVEIPRTGSVYLNRTRISGRNEMTRSPCQQFGQLRRFLRALKRSALGAFLRQDASLPSDCFQALDNCPRINRRRSYRFDRARHQSRRISTKAAFILAFFSRATRSRTARHNFSRSAGLPMSSLRFIASATILA